MFSIPHLIVVFVIALVFFGPEKLPELARNFGKLMGEFRRATGDLRSTFEGHLRDLEREADLRRANANQQVPTIASPSVATATPSSYTASPEALRDEVSAALSAAAGTVPTTPPHLGIGTPVSEPATEAAAAEALSSESRTESLPAPSAPANGTDPAHATEPEHNPESLTDAGIHPA